MKTKNPEYTIGIGVTEHNRPETYAEFMKNIKKFMPPNAKLVVVDDASAVPTKDATFRFEQNVGIARAKNKCLELLRDCDHIFLFDSDCWPKTKDWWKPYVEGREPHYCYIFKDFVRPRLNDCVELYRESDIVAYSHARGCMLYLDQSVLHKVGGMDTNYKRWGYEHVDYSNRIYNVGLTRFRYQDVPNSYDLIYSLDEQELVDSTVSLAERRPYLQEMKPYFIESYKSTHFCPFIEPKGENNGNEATVITSYFTTEVDTQRNRQWVANLDDIQDLINSTVKAGVDLVILHDCFDPSTPVPPNVKLVKVEAPLNPYFQRWVSQWEYLREHPEIGKVFMVDATDVEVLKDPFPHVQRDQIYVGSELTQTWNNWMVVNFPQPWIRQVCRQYARYPLLNCGIVGGSRTDVMALLRQMNTKYFDEQGNVGPFEMGLFNYCVRTYWQGKIVTGNQVHTKFKGYELNNTFAWFKHK